MKAVASILALVATVQAHYTFPSLITGSTTTPEWQYVRQWTNYQSNGPVTDVSSLDIRCNAGGASKSAAGIQTVAAGSQAGFTASPDIYHPGPLMAYMAKVPSGKTAANWDGSGNVWFKIFEQGPTFGSQLTWANNGYTKAMFTIPSSVPAGDYLFRIEHIGLHSASAAGGAQFYISCGQITVTGGGSGTPGPLVAFPGAYKATDPGLMINIYYPVPTTYQMPGPAVWKG
ncbi:uncharacterized protein BP5553_04445 [Venustampulla echinocandica]|uniref:lytic cellulose monooxygenase (C4-dehydrogenating) n=1 Tax=Venustampulla echinocandica TaxID=2656787 RepID=A0A370TNC2_9HELO|nr:uncharacterized protein BP5553_04445 [Venustampulla echinocandica]RDL37012.1 hypothetical protein BP5553_04445 [Venustampulla echinocandica]